MTSRQDPTVRKRDFLEELVYAAFEPLSEETPDPWDLDRQGRVRRYTQDSPVMPDVWIHYGLEPRRRHDLLLTPAFERSPGLLKAELKAQLDANRDRTYETDFSARLQELRLDYGKPRLAFNQTTLAADLWFHEMIRSALPLTSWWHEKLARGEEPSHHPATLLASSDTRQQLEENLFSALTDPGYDAQRGLATRNLAWMTRVVGTIAFAANLDNESEATVEQLRERSRDATALIKTIFDLLELSESHGPVEAELHNINRNRVSTTAIYRSVPSVKGDAARRVFDVKGRGITWAILDSGIDATHWAFRKRNNEGDPEPTPFESEQTRGGPRWKNNTRIKATYDFTRVRDLLSDDPDRTGWSQETVKAWEEIQQSLDDGRSIDWSRVSPALRIAHDDQYEPTHIPRNLHGTHVAGILGADWRGSDDDDDMLPHCLEKDERPNHRTGVCPEISLYDLRVIGEDGTGSEFAVMAALQFVRSLNARRDYVVVHGVNLSLSLHHEVSNYACGRTPVCNESDRLVGAGIVVVTAAGNNGRIRFLTRQGDEEAYLSISITDPGNAESVITVGATHGWEPHNYGVSYFSSRGPTGDGRLKPDLVAPGEKISAPIPRQREDFLDGTSMAAPHVSGGAALLMSRHPELIGHPLRIKDILSETATDLGREPYFQGAGLLDILRALQAV